jgi:type I restriction enzyme S subunit
MGDMSIVKLKDEIEFLYGKSLTAKKRRAGKHPVYGSNGVVDYHNDFCFKGPGIIVGRKGTIGAIELSKTDFWAIDTTYVVNLKNSNDSLEYWYYLLQNLGLKKMNTHSAVPGLNRNAVYMREISVFDDVKERKSVAHILSTLDEKIEVNKQINKTLEKMAQAIFKQWFVDFEFPNEASDPYQSCGGEMVESELGLVPKGWELTELQDIAEITMGQSPKGTSYNENGEGLVFYQGRTDFNIRFPKRRLFTTEPKRIAKKGDILLSVRAPVGDLNIANEECCIGRGLGSLHSKSGYDSYLLYTMFKLKDKFDVFNGEGTVFGSINKNDLCSLKIIKAPEAVISQFEKVVSFFDKQIYTLEMESRNLVNVRDVLLPKLMFGEVRVPLFTVSK